VLPQRIGDEAELNTNPKLVDNSSDDTKDQRSALIARLSNKVSSLSRHDQNVAQHSINN
jgi:hypothetical protein